MIVHSWNILKDINWANDLLVCRSGSLAVIKTAAFESTRFPKILKLKLLPFNKVQESLPVHLLIFANPTCETFLFSFPSSTTKLKEVYAVVIRDLNMQHICDLKVVVRKKSK